MLMACSFLDLAPSGGVDRIAADGQPLSGVPDGPQRGGPPRDGALHLP